MTRRVGIDLAISNAHVAVVVEDSSPIGKPFNFTASLEGYEELLRRAKEGCSETSITFVMEPTGNAWQFLAGYLMERGHEVVIANARTASGFRKLRHPKRKTDARDAENLAMLPDLDPRARPLEKIPDPLRASLMRQVKQRTRLVARTVEIQNQVMALMPLVIPRLMNALGDSSKFGMLGRFLLTQYLNPMQVVSLGKDAFLDLLRGKRLRMREGRFKEVWAAYESAAELFSSILDRRNWPDFESLQDEVRIEIAQLDFIDQQIKDLDSKIEAAYQKLDPQKILLQLPGIGDKLAPTVEAIVGDRVFPNAKALACFAGLTPRVNQSGARRSGGPITKAGNRHLKRAFYLAADKARLYDPEFAAKYRAMEDAGKPFHVIIVALAAKLARRVFALLEQRRLKGGVHYEIRSPEGAPLTEEERRAWVKKNVKNKRERQKERDALRSAYGRKKSQANNSPVDSGQSFDSTIEMSCCDLATSILTEGHEQLSTVGEASQKIVETLVGKMSVTGGSDPSNRQETPPHLVENH